MNRVNIADLSQIGDPAGHVTVGRLEDMSDAIAVKVLDWDYDTFGIDTDDPEAIVLYDDIEGDLVYLEGWQEPGRKLERTLYRRRDGSTFVPATT